MYKRQGYGFEGIAVAALAGNNPLTVLLSAILWGGLKSGASEVNRIASIPMDVISIIQALIVVLSLIHISTHNPLVWMALQIRTPGLR